MANTVFSKLNPPRSVRKRCVKSTVGWVALNRSLSRNRSASSKLGWHQVA